MVRIKALTVDLQLPAPTGEEEGPHAAAFINLQKENQSEKFGLTVESQNLITDLLQLSAHNPEADEPMLVAETLALYSYPPN